MGQKQRHNANKDAEHGAQRHAYRGDLTALVTDLSRAQILGQQDGSGGGNGLQHDDDDVHHLVAVAHGGHGGGAQMGEHELVHVAHQKLQQQLRKNGQGQEKDPAGLRKGG